MPKMPLWTTFQTWFKKYSYTYIGPIAGNNTFCCTEQFWVPVFFAKGCITIIIGIACCIPQRYIFALMGFFTVINGTMMRLSLDLAFPYIVTANYSTPTNYDRVSCPKMFADNDSEADFFNKQRINGTFDWDDAKQTSILQAYSFTYLMVQPIFGMISDKMGGKLVLGYSMLVASVATSFTPLAAVYYGFEGLLYMRYIVGFTTSSVIPVLFSMMSKWVPSNEITFIGAIVFPASLIGQVISMFLVDILTSASGWKIVFYVFGGIGILWFLVWQMFVYSTPNLHPFITEPERDYLNDVVFSLRRTTKRNLDPIPWSACMRSSAVWGICAAYTAKEIAFSTLGIQSRQYLKDVYRLDLADSKLLSYGPFLSMWLISLFFGYMCDFTVSLNIWSLKAVRIFFTVIGAIGSAVAITMIGYPNCKADLATFWLFFGMVATGAFYSGPMIGILDITQDYAGTMIGNVANIAESVAYIMPRINQFIVSNALQYQWRISFGIVTILILLLTFIYLRYVEAQQLWWDDVRTHGYPEDWTHGLLPAEAVIDRNGEMVPKPIKNHMKGENRLS